MIEKDTDMSTLDIDKIDWDMKLYGRPYQVIRIAGYTHLIGGHWGENQYWCYPLLEEPTFDNLIPYDGKAPCWGITVEEKNIHKYGGFSGEQVRNNIVGCIIRNGEPFYETSANDFPYLLAKLQVTLSEIQEHYVCFHERDWEKSIIGSRIYFKGEPAKIESYISKQCCVIVKPDGIPFFKRPSYLITQSCDNYYYEEEYKYGAKTEILGSSITWGREPGKIKDTSGNVVG